MAVNNFMQGTAANLINVAMANIPRLMKHEAREKIPAVPEGHRVKVAIPIGRPPSRKQACQPNRFPKRFS